MIIRINAPHWAAGHALRLAAEFGFDMVYNDNVHVWFAAKDPVERYADWFIEGLRHYKFRYEVETWNPLTDPNPEASGIESSSMSGLPLSPLQPTSYF